MKTKFALAALLGAAASPAWAIVTDCPMGKAPFSIKTPIIDILLSEPAKAVVDKHMPGTIKSMPPFFASTNPPTFAAILSFDKILGMLGGGKTQDLTQMDADLRKLAVTATDTAKRCARYDNDKPIFAKAAKGKTRVLLFEKITGFKDTPSVNAARALMKQLAEKQGWAMEITEKGGAFNAATLKQFDVVIWNNISGDVLTLSQRTAFQRWMAKGGGFLGVHGTAGDPVYFWDWYADSLLGARFIGHPSDPQFQDAKVKIENSPSGIGADLGDGWTMKDEWYSFQKSARLNGANVIATLDETSYTPGKTRFGGPPLAMGADHPIAWTRCLTNGRMFYSAIGHMPETYAHPSHIKLLEQAVSWAAGKGKSTCRAGKEVVTR